MKQLIPNPPIHGLSYAQLIRAALTWKGLVAYHKGLWVLSEEFYELDDWELNQILNDYLVHRDE